MDSKESIETNLNILLELLSKGEFLQAQERFLHDDIILIEGNGQPKQGKAYCMRLEAELLEQVAEFIGYTTSAYAVADGVSFYEVVMEYVEKGGNRVRVEQAVVSNWTNGKITRERFYHT